MRAENCVMGSENIFSLFRDQSLLRLLRTWTTIRREPLDSKICQGFWPNFLESYARAFEQNSKAIKARPTRSKERAVNETTGTTFTYTISTNLCFSKSTKLPSTYRSFIPRFLQSQPCSRHVRTDIPFSCTKAHVYPASDQPSEAEIKQGEEEAAINVRNFAVGCVLLYFSKSAQILQYGGRLLTTFWHSSTSSHCLREAATMTT
jgi:hypothetical protein